MGWFKKNNFEIKNDSWRRKDDEIAIRVDASEIKTRWGSKPIIIFDGTAALAFSKGELLGTLASGKHDVDGPLRKWLSGDEKTVLVLVDDGDITVDLDIKSLYSKENIPLDIGLRMVFNIDPPEMFYENVMKDRRMYRKEDFQKYIMSELEDALLAYTSIHPIQELYHNPLLKQEAALQLQHRIGESLGRLGFVLVSLNVLQVTSKHYDQKRSEQAKVALENEDANVDAARIEVLKKVREDLASNDEHKAVTTADMQDAMHQAMHSLSIKDRLRDDEYKRLQAKLNQDAIDYDQDRDHKRKLFEVEHDLEVDATKKEHDREQSTSDFAMFLDQRIRTATTDAQLRDLDRKGDEKDWELTKKIREDAIEAQGKKKQQEVEVEKERIAAISQADTATKIALGLGDKDALIKLEQLEQQKNLSPEQILYMAAEKSDAVAATIAQKFASEGKLNDEVMQQLRLQLEQERQTNSEHANRLEQILNKALQEMGIVATARADSQKTGNQTIITPSTIQPTIINPNKDD